MVICLQRRIKYVICYGLLFLFVVFMYFVSNYFVFIRYDDKSFVNESLLILENKELKERLRLFLGM